MRLRLLILAACLALWSGCADTTSHSRAVFMLLDTSGTYTAELQKAQAIINYLLATLQPGDSLAVARIDTGSFSERDIIAKASFDDRPSRCSVSVLRLLVDVLVLPDGSPGHPASTPDLS